MSEHICELRIVQGGSAAGNFGSKMVGSFLDSDGKPMTLPPVVKSGDTVTVHVIYPGLVDPPVEMTGVFAVSAAQNAPSQTTGTPFYKVGNGKAVCLITEMQHPKMKGGNSVYEFTPIPYHGGFRGNYELTVVVSDNKANPPVQWSEDPEFDTGN